MFSIIIQCHFLKLFFLIFKFIFQFFSRWKRQTTDGCPCSAWATDWPNTTASGSSTNWSSTASSAFASWAPSTAPSLATSTWANEAASSCASTSGPRVCPWMRGWGKLNLLINKIDYFYFLSLFFYFIKKINYSFLKFILLFLPKRYKK